jgi:TolB-like protein
MTAVVRYLLISLIILSASGLVAAEQAPAGDVTVVAEGFAACPADAPTASCRHAALADALRRAVEKAVGVLVEADTRTKNYRLAQDVVRTTAEGYIRDYRILEEGPSDGAYRVKIEARVAPGKPEKSLKYVCKRLKEEVNPSFCVSVDGSAGRAISSELAALGLRVTIKRGDVGIGGEVRAEPLGEAVAGTKVFSAGASADLSVKDAKSEMILPSVGVSLPQPIAAVSQDQASARAVGAVCRLWIERNVPLIAAALLEPGEPVEIGIGSSTDRSPGIAVMPDSSSGPPPQVILVPAQGTRLILEPDALTPLALKLKNAVAARAEFGSRPVQIAVARFKGIGISDSAAVEDILEDLSTALVKTGVFQLVERSRLDEVLRELRIQNSGLVDSSTAKKLGKLVGARMVLVGSISDRKDCYVINARLIDTESGLVGIAESIVIDKSPEPVILRAGPRR